MAAGAGEPLRATDDERSLWAAKRIASRWSKSGFATIPAQHVASPVPRALARRLTRASRTGILCA
jgi:hypothetical protein